MQLTDGSAGLVCLQADIDKRWPSVATTVILSEATSKNIPFKKCLAS